MLYLKKQAKRFYDRLFGIEAVQEDETEHYTKKARAGEQLERFISEGGWDRFEEGVLSPIEEAAVKAFQETVPTEIHEIIQAQMQVKVVEEIRNRVTSIVNESRQAREALNNLNNNDSTQ